MSFPLHPATAGPSLDAVLHAAHKKLCCLMAIEGSAEIDVVISADLTYVQLPCLHEVKLAGPNDEGWSYNATDWLEAYAARFYTHAKECQA